MLTITSAINHVDFIKVEFIISSDLSCRNRTLNNRGFLWATSSTVVVTVGIDVDGFLGSLEMVC